MHVRLSVLAGSLVVLGSSPAFAQRFGTSGDFAISVERVFAIHVSKVSEESWADGIPDREDSYTGISFGWRGPSGSSLFGNPQATANPFDVPRLAFDYFIAPKLSLGGTLAYAKISDSEDGQEGFGSDSTSSFLINPRVGYALMFSQVVGFWPQGGLTYYATSHDDTHSESGGALTINLPFVISPANHLAFLVGPYLDLGMWGSIEYEPQGGGGAPPDHDRTYRSIGVQFGLAGWL